MDADGSGEISAEEFRVAVRRRLPSLAVLSGRAARGGGSRVRRGRVGAGGRRRVRTPPERAHRRATKKGRGGSEGEGGGGGEPGGGGEGAETEGGEGSGNGEGDGQASRKVVGCWRTSGGDGGERSEGREGIPSGARATPSARSAALADALASLFYTHRRALFHVWHRHFDRDGAGSIAREEFIAAVKALDARGGRGCCPTRRREVGGDPRRKRRRRHRLRGVLQEHRGVRRARARRGPTGGRDQGRGGGEEEGPRRVRRGEEEEGRAWGANGKEEVRGTRRVHGGTAGQFADDAAGTRASEKFDFIHSTGMPRAQQVFDTGADAIRITL